MLEDERLNLLCSEVVNGEAIDVTKWITIHPGGEQAIMAYLGKDATEEWNMIHKPGLTRMPCAHTVTHTHT